MFGFARYIVLLAAMLLIGGCGHSDGRQAIKGP